MRARHLPTVVVFLLLAIAGNALGDTYRFYHTMDGNGRFRVRLKNQETDRYYTSDYLYFKGRAWTVNLPDGTYKIDRSSGRDWKTVGIYQVGDPGLAGRDDRNIVYIGTNQSFWEIDENGKWRSGAGAPPIRLEIAHGLERIPYFGIEGKAHQNPPGVLVTWVERGSAATKLQRNERTYYLESNVDVVTHVNGKPVREWPEMKKMIRESGGYMELRTYDLNKKATFEYTADF